MQEEKLSVRESELKDFEKIVDYFLQSDHDFLAGMGVDVSKLLSSEQWMNMLISNFQKDNGRKELYYIIWLLNNEAIGHSNINKIIYGQEAYMHLHLWQSEIRQKGIGFGLMKMTLPFYFYKFKLKYLYCEPSAANPAPNKTLAKLGFDFIKSYNTVPGMINLYQTVNRWCLTKKKFDSLYTV